MSIFATEIVRDFRGGSSLPVLVRANNGQLFVVKWNGTAEGAITSITDWITTNLAHLAGIRVPQPGLILIQPDLCQEPMDPDIKDLVLRSIGTNLAFEYLPEAIPYQEIHLKSIDEFLRNKIFLFDLLVLNIDRVDSNHNMLFSNGDLFCIDFSASMSIRELVIQRSLTERSLLSLIRRHPFYSETVTSEQTDFEINFDAVNQIVATVPEEWLDEIGVDTAKIKSQLVDGIANLFDHRAAILQQRLFDLHQIHFQNIDERLKISRENRNNFKARFGL